MFLYKIHVGVRNEWFFLDETIRERYVERGDDFYYEKTLYEVVNIVEEEVKNSTYKVYLREKRKVHYETEKSITSGKNGI